MHSNARATNAIFSLKNFHNAKGVIISSIGTSTGQKLTGMAITFQRIGRSKARFGPISRILYLQGAERGARGRGGSQQKGAYRPLRARLRAVEAAADRGLAGPGKTASY